VSQWLRSEFGLLIGFVNNLQVVTTNNYNTIADLQNLQSLHTNLFSLSALVLTDLQHRNYKSLTKSTLPTLLCYSTNKVFKSHVESSQADFLYSFSITNFPWLSPTENRLVSEPKEFCHLYSRGTDMHHRKHIKWPPSTAAWRHRGHGKHSLFYCRVLDRVYRLLPGNALIKSVTVWWTLSDLHL
jgi:hypothetical protein